MNTSTQPTAGSTSPPSCVVMVIYEDDDALKRTMSACDRLVKSMWSKVHFDFRWWRTRFLADPELAEGAAREAAQADLFIVCSANDKAPSTQLGNWLTRWGQIRSGREGALARLTTGNPGAANRDVPEGFLRSICQQAQLDFLGSFKTTT